MRTTIFAAAATAALPLAGIAQAALPPKYQRERELAEVLRVAVAALDEPVDQIARVGEDRYRVLAANCIVIARIETVTTTPMMVGPRTFTVRVERKTCR